MLLEDFLHSVGGYMLNPEPTELVMQNIPASSANDDSQEDMEIDDTESNEDGDETEKFSRKKKGKRKKNSKEYIIQTGN